MKRILLWMLVLMMSISMVASLSLIGCKKAEEAAAPAEEEAAEEVEEEVAPAEEEAVEEPKPVTITVWDLVEGDETSYIIMRELQERFEDDHPWITLDLQALAATDVSDRVVFSTAMMGGEGPDCYNRAYFSQIGPWIDQGFCAPIDEYIENWEYKDDVRDIIWDVVSTGGYGTKDGHIYGFPGVGGTNFSCPIYVNGLYYRKDLFEEVGLDPDAPPKDWDEIVEYAKLLTKPEINQYGYGVLGLDFATWYWEIFVWQCGGELTTSLPDGSVELSFVKQPGIDALQFYQDLKFKYKVTQEDVLEDYGSLIGDFVVGRQAMFIYNIADLPNFLDAGVPRDILGVATMPAGPTGIKSTILGGNNWIINPDSPKEVQDAAWEYVEFFSNPETYKMKWELEEKYDYVVPELTPFKNLDQADYLESIEPEWAKAMNEGAEMGHLEYILKDIIEPYIVTAIQACLLDENADPETELLKAAETIVNEIENTVLPE